jgi:hypothetical protein
MKLKHQSTSTKLHGTISQKAEIFILSALRTWNLTLCTFVYAFYSIRIVWHVLFKFSVFFFLIFDFQSSCCWEIKVWEAMAEIKVTSQTTVNSLCTVPGCMWMGTWVCWILGQEEEICGIKPQFRRIWGWHDSESRDSSARLWWWEEQPVPEEWGFIFGLWQRWIILFTLYNLSENTNEAMVMVYLKTLSWYRLRKTHQDRWCADFGSVLTSPGNKAKVLLL